MATKTPITDDVSQTPWPSEKAESWRKLPLNNFPLDEVFLHKVPIQESSLQTTNDWDFYHQKLDSLRQLSQANTEDTGESSPKPEPAIILIHNQELHTSPGLANSVSFEWRRHDSDNGNSQPSNLPFEPDPKKSTQDRFTLINSAYSPSTLFLTIPADTTVRQPLWLVHIQSESTPLLLPRTVITLEQNSSAQIIESYLYLPTQKQSLEQPGYSGAIATTNIQIQASSRLNYYAMQNWSSQTLSFHYLWAQVESESYFDLGLSQTGSRLHKWFAQTKLNGKGAESRLHGLSLGNKNNIHDLETEKIHHAPHTQSNLNFKSAESQRSFFNFSGLLRMEKSAAYSSANQVNKNLILNKKARAHTTPKLEILVDEVQCAHGATVGDVDQEAIHYLTSRGVSPDQAQNLIVTGFLGDIVEQAPIALARQLLHGQLAKALQNSGL